MPRERSVIDCTLYGLITSDWLLTESRLVVDFGFSLMIILTYSIYLLHRHIFGIKDYATIFVLHVVLVIHLVEK